jgi:hypothetical protein
VAGGAGSGSKRIELISFVFHLMREVDPTSETFCVYNEKEATKINMRVSPQLRTVGKRGDEVNCVSPQLRTVAKQGDEVKCVSPQRRIIANL